MCNLSKDVEEKGVAKGILSSINYDGAEIPEAERQKYMTCWKNSSLNNATDQCKSLAFSACFTARCASFNRRIRSLSCSHSRFRTALQ